MVVSAELRRTPAEVAVVVRAIRVAQPTYQRWIRGHQINALQFETDVQLTAFRGKSPTLP